MTQIFLKGENPTLNNYEKCFLFHPFSSFGSQDIQIFVFLTFRHSSSWVIALEDD